VRSKVVYRRDDAVIRAPLEAGVVANGSREKPHITLGGMEFKHCFHCNTWKRLSKFAVSRDTWDNLQGFCSSCHKSIQAERISMRCTASVE
jgi:5-methylcytosine-specific restriction endonuclease McrA